MIQFQYLGISLDGILHRLYQGNQKKYFDQFTIDADSSFDESDGKRIKRQAFDFNNISYWTSSPNCGPNPWISFCFKHYKVKLMGFEIQTSTGTCFPNQFKFGVSNNPSDYSYQEYSVAMTNGSIVYQDFNTQEFNRCFKYLSKETSSSCQANYRTDIAQIELYGTLHLTDSGDGEKIVLSFLGV